MKTQLALAASFAALLAARAALPCGAPFGTGINVNPQQDIIVAYKGGVETYVFQPTFCGTASSFGLILPVPSTLTTFPALSDQQAFTTVDSLSQPAYVTVTSCTGGTTGGTGRGGVPPSSGVDAGATVVSSGRVGFLDWVQLKADTEKSFTDWLTANGYPYSMTASSVFAYYVEKGWYFVAFRISQRATPDGGSGTVCSALGPVKLSFTTAVPIVPSRMASASTPPTSYGSGFSWRIFGITPGDQQLPFSDGASSNRVLGYSGALAAADVSSLAGLAAAGDRLTKLTLTFSYASTDPDVGLSLASAVDYRETRYITQYIYCPDAGRDTVVDAIPASPDWGPPLSRDADSSSDVELAADAETKLDASPAVDAGTAPAVDAIPDSVADVRIAPEPGTKLDALIAPESGTKLDALPTPDAGMATAVDAIPGSVRDVAFAADAGTKPEAPPVIASADAGAKPDATVPGLSTRGSGCSVAGGSTSGGLFALALLGLAIGGRIRRRR
jgi:MYXO-CTERM domain-containing protein